MAVAPASMADKIIVLDDDDDEEESPRPSCSAYASPAHQQAKRSFPLRAPPPAPTHITQSPFASAKKHTHVLQAENQRLFTEFVDHCSSITQDCPEVLDFLRTKHAKSSPEYLSSVEFRNTVGRCLTHTQAKRSKAYVYINELCTALRQHAVKRRQTLAKVEPGTSASASGFADSPKGEGAGDDATNANEAGERPSGLQEGDNHQAPEAEKKAKRASKRQIAYLENLLKVYNDEISRLQQTDLNLDDLGAEDSIYIQEHRLKRKMMKIYETLCELKNCSTLTGRVIEQRLSYSGTRYPEINRKIERYINSPEAHQNPPDYQDIHHQVLRANERHNLCLSARQLTQIAQEVFTETGSSLQERRHQDLVYNFGSRLTDNYKSATDPALADPSLLRRLRQNREVALSRLKEVVTTYAVRQEDMEEEDRARRLDRDNRDKETHKAENGEGHKVVNGVAPVEEEEEGEDDEDDESSDPDIEEEIVASTQQDGPDGEEDADADANEAEPARDEDPADQLAAAASPGEEEEGSARDEDEEPASGLSPLSDESKPRVSPPPAPPSPRQSPSQSEPSRAAAPPPLSNGNHAGPEEPSRVSAVPVSASAAAEAPGAVSPATANGGGALPAVGVESCDTQTTNGTSPPPSLRTARKRKREREREDVKAEDSRNNKHILIHDSEADIPLDMGVFSCSSPHRAEAQQADTPTRHTVSSSQSTPPPKRNKVNVATQCDPDEVIVLSDSE